MSTTAFAATLASPSASSAGQAPAGQTPAPRALLRQHFGFTNFKPGQEAVVGHLLAGRSAAAVFPTGGGKSLCYQLPALALPGLTLVVSPLIALMKDQIDALAARGIAARRLASTSNGYHGPDCPSDSRCRGIGKVRISFFLRANTPVLTPKPEHVRTDIESVGPRDDPVVDERLREETFVDKRFGDRAMHVVDMAREIKFGYHAVLVGEGNLEIAIGSHRFKPWSHSSPSILLRGCIKPRNLQSSSSSARCSAAHSLTIARARRGRLPLITSPVAMPT
jgi:hypothetical protein